MVKVPLVIIMNLSLFANITYSLSSHIGSHVNGFAIGRP